MRYNLHHYRAEVFMAHQGPGMDHEHTGTCTAKSKKEALQIMKEWELEPGEFLELTPFNDPFTTIKSKEHEIQDPSKLLTLQSL